MNKYKVGVTEVLGCGTWWVEFENKPDMYKWLTKELDKDKTGECSFEIVKIGGRWDTQEVIF